MLVPPKHLLVAGRWSWTWHILLQAKLSPKFYTFLSFKKGMPFTERYPFLIHFLSIIIPKYPPLPIQFHSEHLLHKRKIPIFPFIHLRNGRLIDGINRFCFLLHLPFRNFFRIINYIFKSDNTEMVHKYMGTRSEEHTSELQSRGHLVCRL